MDLAVKGKTKIRCLSFINCSELWVKVLCESVTTSTGSEECYNLAFTQQYKNKDLSGLLARFTWQVPLQLGVAVIKECVVCVNKSVAKAC